MKCSQSAGGSGSVIVQGKSSQSSVIEVTSGCEDLKFMEHVQAHVTLAASKRGDVQIALTSPSGTRSLLIAKRPKDYSRAGFNDWPFLTVRDYNIVLLGSLYNIQPLFVSGPHVGRISYW